MAQLTECLPIMHKAWGSIPRPQKKLDIVAHAYSPSPQEVGARKSEVQGHPQLWSKFEATWDPVLDHETLGRKKYRKKGRKWRKQTGCQRTFLFKTQNALWLLFPHTFFPSTQGPSYTTLAIHTSPGLNLKLKQIQDSPPLFPCREYDSKDSDPLRTHCGRCIGFFC